LPALWLAKRASASDPTAWGEWSRKMATAQLTPIGVGIHNVLIAIDFSRYSNAALSLGLELSHRYHAAAYVVFVVPSDEFMLAGPEAYVAAREVAQRDLLELKSELHNKYPYLGEKDCQLALLEGDVAQAILDFAREKEIDLIVVGSHGRGGLGKAVLGSVAERVFRHSPVPVLTVGPQVERTAGATAPRNVLLAVDFTANSERAIKFAIALARQHDAKLTLLHVVEHWPTEAEGDRACVMQGLKEKLAALVQGEGEGLRCSFRIEVGGVTDTILYTANGIEADLVVMGARSQAKVLDRVKWPHTYQVMRAAACPVVTVRSDAVQD